MKLVNFIKNGQGNIGVKTTNGILEVEFFAKAHGFNVENDINKIIASEEAFAELKSVYEKSLETDFTPFLVPEDSLEFGPVVTKPQKVICVGVNYRDHAEESKMQVPDYPVLFNKFANSIAGHNQKIQLPEKSFENDYEAELGIVIGKEAKNVTKEDALNYVFGYFNANDLSSRDLQFRTSQWLLGKALDNFCPIGPYLVTSDEIPDPHNLSVKTFVNGEIRQNSNTKHMIFDCNYIISYISEFITLVPGDIILTGTPEGVIFGYPPEKRNYLKPGDEIIVEIENLGTLKNQLV